MRPPILSSIIVLALLWPAAGCLRQVDSRALTPEFYASATAGLRRPAEAVAELNRELAWEGQEMTKATEHALTQRYWYIRWVEDWWSYYELATKAIPWAEVSRVEVLCPAGGWRPDAAERDAGVDGCTVAVFGALSWQRIDIVEAPTRARAERLHALILWLARHAGAEASPFSQASGFSPSSDSE